MRKILFALIVLSLCSWLLAETMPEFKLPDVNGKEIELSDVLGKGPVLIDFWATWCVPCKKGMVALNELANRYDSLTVVMISIDAPKDVSKAKNYLKTNDYKFIGLFDSEKKLAKKLNVINPPRTIILDKTGSIIMSHDGYEPGTEKIYEAKIRELLGMPAEQSSACPEDSDNEACGACK
jgi:peroxiredoxin